jgi:hypothetical protein
MPVAAADGWKKVSGTLSNREAGPGLTGRAQKQGSESNFLLIQSVWRTLSWAADLLRAYRSPELLLDHSAEAVGAIGLLVLGMSANGVGFGRVDGLCNEAAARLLTSRSVRAGPTARNLHGISLVGASCQEGTQKGMQSDALHSWADYNCGGADAGRLRHRNRCASG